MTPLTHQQIMQAMGAIILRAMDSWPYTFMGCADALHFQADISAAELRTFWDDARPVIDYQVMMAAYREECNCG